MSFSQSLSITSSAPPLTGPSSSLPSDVISFSSTSTTVKVKNLASLEELLYVRSKPLTISNIKIIKTAKTGTIPTAKGLLQDLSEKGDVKGVQNLLTSEKFAALPKDTQEADLHEALLRASKRGYLQVVRLLLVNLLTKSDNLPSDRWSLGAVLVEASTNGHVEIVRLVLRSAKSAGISISAFCLGWALDEASIKEHRDVIPVLVNSAQFASISKNDLGDILYKLSYQGHIEAVQALVHLPSFANISKQSLSSALCIAAINDHQDVVQVLCKPVKLKDYLAIENNIKKSLASAKKEKNLKIISGLENLCRILASKL